jgi:hypothetical protein
VTSGPIGAVVAVWLAVALVGSYELLMMVIRKSQAAPDAPSDTATMPDPLHEQAAEGFGKFRCVSNWRGGRPLPLPDGVGQVGHPLRRLRADRLQGHAARVHALEQADSGAEQHG